jgi:hypothetical protein
MIVKLVVSRILNQTCLAGRYMFSKASTSSCAGAFRMKTRMSKNLIIRGSSALLLSTRLPMTFDSGISFRHPLCQ